METKEMLGLAILAWPFTHDTYELIPATSKEESFTHAERSFALTHIFKHVLKGANWIENQHGESHIPSREDMHRILNELLLDILRAATISNAPIERLDFKLFGWWGRPERGSKDNERHYGTKLYARNTSTAGQSIGVQANYILELLEPSDHGRPLPDRQINNIAYDILFETGCLADGSGLTRSSFEAWLETQAHAAR